MTDFSLYNEGMWRDGEIRAVSGVTYIVNWDTRNYAYHIQRDDYDDFILWLAKLFEDDERHWEDDEDPNDYLDRIGATVREA